ncbi:hypothetical protein Q4493_03955 [Colwellia sp. 1_MG-2023]|uniref:hypothetical protein n=1 Tax=Colwellia sp. 1_MG-2023 TaxID=3062649 RepID=UPI0026E44730|nr:hypothetical protein [Colwellia sp. 1_MG-2023]MDO6444924.1 hypothetical protein [Colwellia sp. 1_MG-2023]
MVAKKAYPLRINEEILNAMQQWSDDELRSLNAQIEYVLRDALRKAGRSKPRPIEPIIDPIDE